MEERKAEFLTNPRKATVIVVSEQIGRLFVTLNEIRFEKCVSCATVHVYDCYIAIMSPSSDPVGPLEREDITFEMAEQIKKAATAEDPFTK